MALIFKPVRSSIANKAGNRLFHPCLIKMDTVDLPAIAKEITELSSVSPGDVHSVITNLMSSMRRHLLNSNSVKLNGFGTFTIIAHSNDHGVPTEEEVSASQISRLVIRFMPQYTRSPFAGKKTRFYDGVVFRSLADMEESLKNNGVLDQHDDDDHGAIVNPDTGEHTGEDTGHDSGKGKDDNSDM